MFGWKEAVDRGRFIVPIDEILMRLPRSLFFGLIGVGIYYKFIRSRPTLVSPKCGVAQYSSDSKFCSCGGQLEDIQEMKWV